MRLSVVYFIYLFPTHDWRVLLTAQLTDLRELSAVAADTHIVISGDGDSGFAEAETLARRLLPAIHIHPYPNNNYEYAGLALVHRLAVQSKDPSNHLILYHHSKGMVNSNHQQVRTHENMALTRAVILPWRQIVAHFASNPLLMKAGYAADTRGLIWFNFWWARASYLQRLSPPAISSDRYQYEEWLSQLRDGSVRGFRYSGAEDCLSLCTGTMNTPLTSGEVMTRIMAPLAS